jgi:hypothetical protein
MRECHLFFLTPAFRSLYPKLHLVILHFVPMITIARYPNILPRLWTPKVFEKTGLLHSCRICRIVSGYSFEFLTILCPKTFDKAFTEKTCHLLDIFATVRLCLHHHQEHQSKLMQAQLLSLSMQNGYHPVCISLVLPKCCNVSQLA